MMNIYQNIGMRALPIFKPEMRKANRDGLKSQTRRVMDPQPPNHSFTRYPTKTFNTFVGAAWYMHCPYGRVGDIVYMREPLKRIGNFAYYADDENIRPAKYFMTDNPIVWRWKRDMLSSMFMPAEAARFIYQYKSIRVERVQDITRDDAKAEGVSGVWVNPPANEDHYQRVMLNPYVANYSVLWDEINGERGFGWDANPWVWVLEYTPIGLSATSPKSKSDLGEEERGVR